jgi:hypothetical protein
MHWQTVFTSSELTRLDYPEAVSCTLSKMAKERCLAFFGTSVDNDAPELGLE